MSAKPIASKLDRPEFLAAIFHPRTDPASPPPDGCTELAIPVADDCTLVCRFHISAPESPTILYFHGNGETVGDYDALAPRYLEAGLNLFVASYRGYGWSDGQPTVSAIYADAAAILQYVVSYLDSQGMNNALFCMGRSLGSVSCIDLADRYPDRLQGIIIESGFADSLPLAARLGYDVDGSGLSEQDCFNNVEKIREIELPTLLMHGAEDQLIPLTDAVKLQAESGAKNKQLFIIPGADHSSIIEVGGTRYFETLKRFTDEVTGQNTWRHRRRKFKAGGD